MENIALCRKDYFDLKYLGEACDNLAASAIRFYESEGERKVEALNRLKKDIKFYKEMGEKVFNENSDLTTSFNKRFHIAELEAICLGAQLQLEK